MSSKRSQREQFSPEFTADNLLSVLVKYFRVTHELSDDVWDSIRSIDTLCDNRFPVTLCSCTVFSGRQNVLPSIYMPGKRNVLTENLCLNPETVFIAKDPALLGMAGVFMAVASTDYMLPCKWLMRQGKSAKLIVGDHRGLRLIAAPLISFT